MDCIFAVQGGLELCGPNSLSRYCLFAIEQLVAGHTHSHSTHARHAHEWSAMSLHGSKAIVKHECSTLHLHTTVFAVT